jgi:hypothetical protein
MLSKIDGVAQRLAGIRACSDRREIEHGEWNHGSLEMLQVIQLM